MDEARLAARLARDEGIMYQLYCCTENHLTGGIGHKVLKNEPEYKQPIGTKISKERVNEWFQADLRSVMLDCERLFPNDWSTFPEDFKQIVANMMFQMGLGSMRKFKNWKKAVLAKDSVGASDEMYASKWRRQTPNRAGRLINEMKGVKW